MLYRSVTRPFRRTSSEYSLVCCVKDFQGQSTDTTIIKAAPPPNRKPLSIIYLFPVFSNHTLQNELCLRLPWDFRFWAFRINEVLRPVAFRSVISSELKTHVIASTSLRVFLLSSILFVRYNMFNLFISW